MAVSSTSIAQICPAYGLAATEGHQISASGRWVPTAGPTGIGVHGPDPVGYPDQGPGHGRHRGSREAIQVIVTAARTRPEKPVQPFTRWSLRKLAAYLAEGPGVCIGRERLRQVLHARGISFQRTRTWKESTDPDRDAKLDRIEYVTSHYPDRCFAFEQFGPLSIRPCHGTCWAPRKHPVRLRATYHRTHGTRYFHGCYGISDDQLQGVTREHKGGGHTLAALKSIRAARPGGYRLFIIMDHLAANKTPAIRR